VEGSRKSGTRCMEKLTGNLFDLFQAVGKLLVLIQAQARGYAIFLWLEQCFKSGFSGSGSGQKNGAKKNRRN
jgi:hypothetical protein